MHNGGAQDDMTQPDQTGAQAALARESAVEGAGTALTPEALGFVGELAARFGPRVDALLSARAAAQERFNGGELPGFDPGTEEIRSSEWTASPVPDALEDRRVEITAPAEAKKIVIALNSPARAYMADFEDSLSPTWANVVGGQVALRRAVEGRLELRDERRGKDYRLDPDHSCELIVRPRGWHLPERNVTVDGRPVPGALVDFGLFFFHNAATLAGRRRGPFYYLPKLEHWREAELWDDVMAFAERRLDVPLNTAKATVLIETLPAVFQMHEIIHALRGRIAGLNCGRWDYIFSYIKTLRGHGGRTLPDRRQVTMAVPFLDAYSLELVRTCHRRGCHAMGGMAALIPIANDPEANARALDGVRADKAREVGNGHDGTWVAHPDLIAVAAEVFDREMPEPNQKGRVPPTGHTAEQLLACPDGPKSPAEFSNNVRVALHYVAAWLSGAGAVPIFNLMEDAATAEISRSQLWQWIRDGQDLDGTKATAGLFEAELATARDGVAKAAGEALAPNALGQAADLLRSLVVGDDFQDFLTTGAYALID